MASVTARYEPHDDASWIVADTRIPVHLVCSANRALKSSPCVYQKLRLGRSSDEDRPEPHVG
jgi:hypothetical protein